MENNATCQVNLKKWTQFEWLTAEDTVAVEAPLEIDIIFNQNGKSISQPLSVTMRTPGHDPALVLGFLFTEGIVSSMNDVEKISQPLDHKVSVHLKAEAIPQLTKADRHFYTNSSCGVCGKTSLSSVIQSVPNACSHDTDFSITISLLQQLQKTLAAHQIIFAQTGGLHASAIFNKDGTLYKIHEDVGRHNALDKVIGHAFMHSQLPLSTNILLLSGRVSFELVQKAAMAGIPVVVAVGAPSSMAVQMAGEQGITLIGFLRNDKCNVYTGHQRMKTENQPVTHAKNIV